MRSNEFGMVLKLNSLFMRSLNTLIIALFFIIASGLANLKAQTLIVNGELHEVTYNGTYQDFTIPAANLLFPYDYITFFLKGADGGKTDYEDILKKAGGGAKVEASFEVGNAAGQLKPGGTVRVIIGEQGNNGRSDNSSGGGGGGGTGLLYHAPGATITCSDPSTDLVDSDDCWVILAVAGAGGGAENSQQGENAPEDSCGSRGSGDSGEDGDGGCDGDGGETGGSRGGGGGGGYLTDGGANEEGGKGRKGGFEGGEGGLGSGSKRKGGFGYGGGGSGNVKSSSDLANRQAGGGGGGYSGGGGGRNNGGGGGGGSFVNASAISSTIERGERDGTPNNGRFNYEFTQFDPDSPTARCKNISVALIGGSYTLNASEINNNSEAEAGENIGLFILIKLAGINVPVPSIQLDCNDVGEKQVKMQVISTSGKKDKCVAIVQVEDDVAPTVSCTTSPPANPVVSRGQPFILDPDDAFLASQDACGQKVEKFLSKEIFTCSDVGANVVRLTVEDESGNEASCNYSFTLTAAEEALSLSCPPDAAVELRYPDCSFILGDEIMPILGGPCGSDLSYTIFKGDNFEDNGLETPIGNALIPGTYTISYIHSDNGVSFDCSFQLSIYDVDDTFSLSCPGDFEVDLTDPNTCIVEMPAGALVPTIGECALPENLDYKITHPSDGSINSFTEGSGVLGETGFGAGTSTIQYDLGPNSCSFQVRIFDLAPPAAVCQLLTVALDENCSVTVSTDDLDNGSNDACGDVTLAAYYQDCTNPTCMDVGPVASVTYTMPGDYDVILKVTDESGNTSDCSAVVIVEDETPPTAICIESTATLDDNGVASIIPDDVHGNSTDNCGTVTPLAVIPSDFDCSSIGDNTVTLFVEDDQGNGSTCSATVTVEDSAPFMAVCANQTVQLDASGSAELLIEAVNISPTNNCSEATAALSQTLFDCTDIGMQSVTLTLIDNLGNPSSCTAIITVEDPIAPTAHCHPTRTIYVDANGSAVLSVGEVENGSIDNCGITNSALDITNFDCSQIGNQTIMLTVTDENQNSATCTATVTIADNLPPLPVCLHSTINFNGESQQLMPVSQLFDAANSTDNCGSVFLSASNVDVVIDCGSVGSILSVIVTAEDDQGNESSCTANITVEGFPCGWKDMGGIGCLDDLNTSAYTSTGDFELMANNCAPVFPYSNESTAFIFTELCGDGEIIAEVTNMTGTGYAGVMMRDDLSSNAAMVAMGTNRVDRVRKQVRILPGYPAWPQQVLSYDKFWVRISRVGNMFQAYASSDGSFWTPYINQQVMMSNNCLQVGLYAYSEKPGTPLSANFRNVSVTGQTSLMEGVPQTVEMGEQVKIIPDIRIYPNPTQTVVNIDLGDFPDQSADVQLFNGLGQQLLCEKVETELRQLDVSALAPGVYSLVLQIGELRIVRRLVIAKE